MGQTVDLFQSEAIQRHRQSHELTFNRRDSIDREDAEIGPWPPTQEGRKTYTHMTQNRDLIDRGPIQNPFAHFFFKILTALELTDLLKRRRPTKTVIVAALGTKRAWTRNQHSQTRTPKRRRISRSKVDSTTLAWGRGPHAVLNRWILPDFLKRDPSTHRPSHPRTMPSHSDGRALHGIRAATAGRNPNANIFPEVHPIHLLPLLTDPAPFPPFLPPDWILLQICSFGAPSYATASRNAAPQHAAGPSAPRQ